MPVFINRLVLLALSGLFIWAVLSPQTAANEGISQYYIRYDVKSSKNRIVDENLLMVPAPNEFRTENFSYRTVSGAISADLGETESALEERIRKDLYKKILKGHGLKSLTAKDHDTVVSYEGAIRGKVAINTRTYIPDTRLCQYEAAVAFSPIAFPEEWETLGRKHWFKSFFTDFLDLFK